MDRLLTESSLRRDGPREVETDRLLLRQWRDEDAEPLYEIYAQPEYLETMPAKTSRTRARRSSRFRQRWDDDGYCQWAACERETGRLIGRVGLLVPPRLAALRPPGSRGRLGAAP